MIDLAAQPLWPMTAILSVGDMLSSCCDFVVRRQGSIATNEVPQWRLEGLSRTPALEVVCM